MLTREAYLAEDMVTLDTKWSWILERAAVQTMNCYLQKMQKLFSFCVDS